jgi:hypothetical protein
MAHRKKWHRVINGKGQTVISEIPGKFVGWNGGRPGRRIYGRLNCKSVMRMNPEKRVFFSSRKAALKAGYHACKNCKP